MIALAARLARRELRGGLSGFRVFLACLALGVAAIAAVGLVRSAIQAGLSDQGAVLLGGDAEISFTYRFADDAERAFITRIATAQSEIVDFRSMAVVGEDRALTQVKAVDSAYPLNGAVELDPPMPLADALANNGAVMDRILADRLGLKPNDTFQMGESDFRLSAILTREPDSASGGFALGPRTLVLTQSLDGSGLIQPGSLFDTSYRLTLPPGTDLDALKTQAETQFRDKGLRWADSRRAAPGVDRFVERMGAFLILVGLAGLAVGGVGIQSAVRAYLQGKIPTIATLRTLGAPSSLIFRLYLIQIGALALVGILAGLILGALAILIAAPFITAALPFPVSFGLYPMPMVEAAFYGAMTALVFTLWPLARSENIRAAALYRGADHGHWPKLRRIALILGAVAVLLAGAVWFSDNWRLALGSALGVVLSLILLAVAALLLRWLCRRLARSRLTRGRTALRLALAAIGGPRDEAMPVVLSLGLGLTVLAAVGQIDANLRTAIATDLPTRAPSFFFVDIQPDQIDGFLERVKSDPAVSDVETAPMLRGIITLINGRPAREVAGPHWVLNGDRGISYADAMPPGTKVTAGQFWPADYDGPPQLSFAAEEAAELGLKLGDRMTVNVLGRDIEAEITSLRDVDFSNAGMGFVMLMNGAALRGAPHSHIATVYMGEQAEATLLRDLSKAYPNLTAIRVKEAIDRVTEALSAIATATAWAAAATLLTGFVVLIGAAAAGEKARVYEAAVLKTLGATRGRILTSFALRSALTGAAAGLVAVLAAALSAWAVLELVMEVDYAFEPWSALGVVGAGLVVTLLAGLAFAARPLGVKPARVLRNEG
jgi:putative ABC transport system permease protein